MDILSKSNTQALKGFAAIGIVIFHILLGYDISPVFNMWGGFFVSLFLILSGYGLEESFRKNGLDNYWPKRLDKVLLPTAFFIFAYNFIFPFLSPDGNFTPDSVIHKCLNELLYVKPTFWFIFFILKCYVIYWIGTRFMGERLRLLFFVACALISLNIKAPSAHLEAEQSFSFLAGVMLSMNKHKVESLTKKEMMRWMLLLLFIGLMFLCLKSIPTFHSLKGRIAYNYFLCPFRLSVGLAFIPLLSLLGLAKYSLMRVAGKYSLEIYVAHIPFIVMIVDAKSTVVFFGYSVLAFLLLLIYRAFVENKLSVSGSLFILINVFFVAKYSMRISKPFMLVATLGACVFYYVLLRFLIPNISKSRRLVCGFCLLSFVSMLVMQYAIDPYAIQVDRWSALHFPIRNLLAGIYPYSAITHLGGSASPFPVWQILHVPFYLMGNVGLSFFAVTAFFLCSCYKVQGREKALVVCVLLCSSVAVWYEVAVRSDLITNFLLLAAIINLASIRLTQQWAEKQGWWIACAVGVLTCTRVLVLIPVTLLLLPYFIKMRCQKQIALVLLALGVFALTFAPFALWDWQEFYYFQNNPWALQTRQGNLSDFILFVPLAAFLSLNHKGDWVRYARNVAVMLVVFIFVTFVHNMYIGENWDLFSPTYDITYFSTAIPFCLLALSGKNKA